MTEETKVLVIDDSQLIRKIIRDIAEELGCEVFDASNAEEAITIYDDQRPEIVFMDIMLSGRNGIEALQDIKNINEHAIVIMCSSIIGQENVIIKAHEFGASEFITKPFKKEEMVNLINKYKWK